MFNLNQWITWQPVQVPGEPKPRKVPTDGVNPAWWDGVDIQGAVNAHNAASWRPFDVVSLMSSTVGFVLTEADPYFVIDIDHALQADGTWSPLAVAICKMFPGAFIEVSFTGDGLHIFARGVIPEGFKHKNSALGLEVYDRRRFIAVTRTGATGSPDVDHQDALNAFLTAYMERAVDNGNPLQWTTGPRDDWNGPVDDDELIAKMLASRPSANALWGNAATIEDLWTGNTAALIESYPDGKGGVDESSVDMALASHLAFWTGCDCERIERLMWRSGLARQKWTDHRTYLREFTIVKAAASCQNVYSDPRAASTVEQPVEHTDADAESVSMSMTPTVSIRQGVQFLTPTAQIDYFKGCVYIINTHRVLLPNGEIIGPEQFKVIYGGYEFAMDNENHKSSKCAWEAFTKSRAYNTPMAHGMMFRPDDKRIVIEHDGLTFINAYRPAPVRRMQGDPTPFLTHMAKLFPNDRDRLIIISYMAACVQHIGKKFQWCPLIQGVEGNGKTFITEAMENALGDRLCHRPNASDIANKFNAWLENKVFAAVEEIYISDRRDAIDALKILITNSRVEIQPKGGNQYMGDNRANFVMNTNHQDAIRKTKDDRRYAPFFTPQQSRRDIERDGMGGDYFPNLYEWARADGFAIVTEYLTTFDIPDELNPATLCHRAPDTSTTGIAIEKSLGPAEQEVVEAIEECRQGFRGGWVSAKALDDLLRETGKSRMIPRNKRSEMLDELGFVKVGRATIEIPKEGGRPMLYAKPDTPMTADIAFDYMTAQGYMTP